jgi:hypothetical protein
LSANAAEVHSNVEQFQKRLNLIATSQLPFVVSKALNATAVMAKAAVQKHFQDVLDRPTPFTQNAVTIRYATKSNLTAFMLVKDKQAAYLKRQEAGCSNPYQHQRQWSKILSYAAESQH